MQEEDEVIMCNIVQSYFDVPGPSVLSDVECQVTPEMMSTGLVPPFSYEEGQESSILDGCS